MFFRRNQIKALYRTVLLCFKKIIEKNGHCPTTTNTGAASKIKERKNDTSVTFVLVFITAFSPFINFPLIKPKNPVYPCSINYENFIFNSLKKIKV